MSIIKVLDPILANKIAAGEVVERPLSVVKELVENSIDANATSISIDLIDSGIKSIQITDNGHGMSNEDAKLAFLRHATSKISSDRDLFSIHSLGFRGEALPAIASVSKVKLNTGQTDNDFGIELILHAGKEISSTKSAIKGTTIVVDDLFYNTPARLNYLKSVHYELGAISDIIQKFAIAYPNISFKFTNNNTQLLTTRGDGNVEEILSRVFGVEVGSSLIQFAEKTADFSFSGYYAAPVHQKFNRQSIYIIVNKRIIKNFAISKAVIDAFHTYIPDGKYPIVYIDITLDPMLIDVNVHPTKQEVRIAIEKAICEQVKQTIKNKLHTSTNMQSFAQTTQFESFSNLTDKGPNNPNFNYQNRPNSNYEAHRLTAVQTQSVNELFSDQVSKNMNVNQEVSQNSSTYDEQITQSIDALQLFDHKIIDLEQKQQILSQNSYQKIEHFDIIGQYNGTYIIGQTDSGLILVDQHAAAERINYEKYLDKMTNSQFHLQDLMLPITLNATPSQQIKLEDYRQQLADCGIVFRQFSENTIAIDSLPTWIIQGKESSYAQMIVDWVLEHEQVTREQIIEKAAITLSCKLSIKANQRLSNYEMRDLIDQLDKCEQPFTCPHGRPTIVFKRLYEIEKWFKRV